jgi:metallophosphoesterase superfamily enzyme
MSTTVTPSMRETVIVTPSMRETVIVTQSMRETVIVTPSMRETVIVAPTMSALMQTVWVRNVVSWQQLVFHHTSTSLKTEVPNSRFEVNGFTVNLLNEHFPHSHPSYFS